MNSLQALCLLLLVPLPFLAYQVQAQKKKHLCSRLAKRQLDRIHLKSITFSSSLQLIIFEGEHFYRIDDGGGDGKYDDHIPLPPEYELELWNRTELSEAVEKIKHWFQYNTEVTHSPTSAYFFTSGKKFAENFFGHLNKMALLLSKTNEALFSIAPGLLDSKDSYPATLIYDRPRPAEEFALIVRQESDDEKFFFEGYVLHKDTWQNSSQYVLYDLQLKEGSAEIVLYLKQKDQQHLEKEQPAPAVYYLIQRTSKPNEALLVKGGKGNAEEEEEVSIADKYSPRRSLFGGMDKQYLPVGYRHGKYTFLFDQMLGCVYRLELEQGLDLGTKSLALIRVKRTNIPYERFFRCNVERFPVPVWNSEERLQVERRWPADRCDRNVLSEEGGGGGGGGETTPSAGEEAVDWKMVGAISGGGLLLLVVFFGFFFCTYRPGGRKQQQFQHGGGERKKMHPRLKMADSSSSTAASTASSNAASSNSSVASNRERKKSHWAKKMKMMIKEGGKKRRKGGGRR